MIGLLAGVAIRLFQLVLIISCFPRAPLLSEGNLAAMAVISGSPALMAALPALSAVALSLLFILIREVLIRGLFRWVAQTAG